MVLPDTFPCYSAYVPSFQISYYSRAIILVSASYCFTLDVLMLEVSCVGYTPRAWDPRFLQSILDGPLYIEAKWLNVWSVASLDRCSINHETKFKNMRFANPDIISNFAIANTCSRAVLMLGNISIYLQSRTSSKIISETINVHILWNFLYFTITIDNNVKVGNISYGSLLQTINCCNNTNNFK